jgi:hypothetical protein
MTLIFSAITVELTWRYAFFAAGAREVFVQYPTGLPLRFLSKVRHEEGVELWGLGMKIVASRALVATSGEPRG